MYALLFSCIALLLGLLAIITSIFLPKALPKELFEGIIWLGIYILAAMVWVLTDSTLLLLFTGNTYLINFVSFLSFFLMPFSMLEFTTRVMPGKKDVFLLFENLNLLLLITYLINRFFMVIPVILLLISIHLLIIVTMLQSLWQGFHELRKEKNPRLLQVLLGYIFLFIFTGIALILFYKDDNLSYSQLYVFGMSEYIFFLISGVAIGIYDMIKENANIALYAKLAYLDMMTNMLNRTAFIADQESDQAFHGSITYIMIDANNLKMVNDTFGHEKGDFLIMEIASCIQKIFKDKGKCYRTASGKQSG